MDDATPRFSLVVPAYNEEQYLPRLLDSVDIAAERFGHAVEVIVANNSSTDRTEEIAETRSCRVATVEPRQIAAARNGGAAIAQGEIVCFIDADSQLHPNAFVEIDGLMRTGKYLGGGTSVDLERNSLGLWCTWSVVRMLLCVTRTSGGMFFCDAQAFREIGGFPTNRDFAEDVAFFVEMKRLARKRGLKVARKIDARMIASTRKFDRHGDWHMFYMIFWIPLRHGSLRKLVRAYWYDDAR